jgi:antitoxin VapB
MKTIASLFENGRSQAVRLPKKLRFKCKKVSIRKFGNGVLILPEEDDWENWYASMESCPSDLFPERDQPDWDDKRDLSL